MNQAFFLRYPIGLFGLVPCALTSSLLQAKDFHVYGFEWGANGVKYYVDGTLFSDVPADKVRAWALENREVPEDYGGYVPTVPISIWIDQETFPWADLPTSKEALEANSPEGEKDDGVVDFEMEYVRIWQRK